MTERFVTALKAQKFTIPVSGYSVILTGVVSPMAAQALASRGVNVKTKALPAAPMRIKALRKMLVRSNRSNFSVWLRFQARLATL